MKHFLALVSILLAACGNAPANTTSDETSDQSYWGMGGDPNPAINAIATVAYSNGQSCSYDPATSSQLEVNRETQAWMTGAQIVEGVVSFTLQFPTGSVEPALWFSSEPQFEGPFMSQPGFASIQNDICVDQSRCATANLQGTPTGQPNEYQFSGNVGSAGFAFMQAAVLCPDTTPSGSHMLGLSEAYYVEVWASE